MDVEHEHASGRKSIPGFAKTIIVAQSIAILYFIYWTIEEYNNNYYFQQYLSSSFQGGLGSAVILGVVGASSMICLGLFVKLHQTHKELDEIVSIEATGQTVTQHARQRSGMLDDATERHLVEMIRRRTNPEGTNKSDVESTPSNNAQSNSAPGALSTDAGSPLPVLKRVDERRR